MTGMKRRRFRGDGVWMGSVSVRGQCCVSSVLLGLGWDAAAMSAWIGFGRPVHQQ